MYGEQAFTSNSIKTASPFETFSYLDQLLTFQHRQPPRSRRSKKLNYGLMSGFGKQMLRGDLSEYEKKPNTARKGQTEAPWGRFRDASTHFSIVSILPSRLE